MPDPLIVPPASALPQEHANWLELQAVKAHSRISSFQDLVQEIRRMGTTDVMGDLDEAEFYGDIGGERSETVAVSAFEEIENRFQACGGETGNYPFEIGEQSIQLIEEDHPYMFLLLLARYGHRAGPKGSRGDKLFEEVCAQASKSYFGASNPLVESRVFGHPRIGILSRSFKKALDQLCYEMREGGGSTPRPRRRHQMDAKLDIVVWQDFCDMREGKIIGFGNCTTSQSWHKKLSELQPLDWCKHWMVRQPTVTPVKFFFVPHIVDSDDWSYACDFGGIFFDRCRITQHSSCLDPDLLGRCTEWSEYVRENRLC